MKTPLNWFYTHKSQVIPFLFWISIVISYWIYANAQNLTPWEMIQQVAHLFMDTASGRLLFVLVFSVQPLLFIPSALMGIAAGSLFGPVWGVLLTTTGAMGAALVTYGTGYFFGRDPEESDRHNLLGTYRQRLHDNTFETLLVVHLLFLPFDFVNYISGFLRLPLKPFLAATFIGSIPGIFAFVFFGASMEFSTLEGGTPELDWRMLLASAVLMLISIGISRYIKQRNPAPPPKNDSLLDGSSQVAS